MAAADMARRLIDKFGRHDGELLRPALALQTAPDRPWASEAIDPAVDPSVGANLAVVVLDALTVLKAEQLLPEQTAVAYMSADVEPKNLDILTTSGQRYSILRVEELAPGVDIALYTLHLKGR